MCKIACSAQALEPLSSSSVPAIGSLYSNSKGMDSLPPAGSWCSGLACYLRRSVALEVHRAACTQHAVTSWCNFLSNGARNSVRSQLIHLCRDSVLEELQAERRPFPLSVANKQSVKCSRIFQGKIAIDLYQATPNAKTSYKADACTAPLSCSDAVCNAMQAPGLGQRL